MKDLPPEAVSLLERARVAHEPTSEQLAGSLSKLHASLDFAPEVTSSPLDGPPVRDAAIARGGLLATRAVRGALLTVVLGAAVGSGFLWLRLHSDPVVSLPTVAPAASPAPAATASSQAALVPSRAQEPRSSTDAREPAADEMAPPSEPTGLVQPSASLAPPAQRASVASHPGVAVGKRAPASRSVAARGRAGRERARGPSAIASPAESASVSASVAGAASPSTEDTDSAGSTSDSRSLRTLAPPLPSELTLIDGALSSLRDHDPRRSLTLLAQHAELYPHGELATERRGLRVLALCALGERVRAAHERAAYLADDPHTPMAERVRRTCGPEGEP